jgi:hypothetical protein
LFGFSVAGIFGVMLVLSAIAQSAPNLAP